jgi:hypothetical protein
LKSKFQCISPIDTEVQKIELTLRTNGSLMQSWPYPSGGAESKVNDRLLSIYLGELNRLFTNPNVIYQGKTPFPFETQLCNSVSQQECFIVYRKSVILASEAKGVESSDAVAMMQCVQACSDGALNLFSKGLTSADCVVPGVICCGETFSIVAAYFVPTSFPVLVYLSSALHICNCDDRVTLSRWCVALYHFGLETIDLLKLLPPDPVSTEKFRLSNRQFFKPVRNIEKIEGSSVNAASNDVSCARMNLNMLMHVYSLLSVIPLIDRYVLLPIGVVSCPSKKNKSGDEIRELLSSAMETHFPKWSEEVGGGDEEGGDGPQGEGERPSEKGVVMLAADEFNHGISTFGDLKYSKDSKFYPNSRSPKFLIS